MWHLRGISKEGEKKASAQKIWEMMPEDCVAQEASEESVLSSSRENKATLRVLLLFYPSSVFFLYNNTFLQQETTSKSLLQKLGLHLGFVPTFH